MPRQQKELKHNMGDQLTSAGFAVNSSEHTRGSGKKSRSGKATATKSGNGGNMPAPGDQAAAAQQQQVPVGFWNPGQPLPPGAIPIGSMPTQPGQGAQLTPEQAQQVQGMFQQFAAQSGAQLQNVQQQQKLQPIPVGMPLGDMLKGAAIVGGFVLVAYLVGTVIKMYLLPAPGS